MVTQDRQSILKETGILLLIYENKETIQRSKGSNFVSVLVHHYQYSGRVKKNKQEEKSWANRAPELIRLQ